MNNVKTFVLMAGLLGLFVLVGQLIGGSSGLIAALVIGSLFNFVMYFFSVTLVTFGRNVRVSPTTTGAW